jgi:hypothetical protein
MQKGILPNKWPTHLGSKRITLRTWATCWEQKKINTHHPPQKHTKLVSFGCMLAHIITNLDAKDFYARKIVIGFVDFYFSFTITTIKSNVHLKCIKPGIFQFCKVKKKSKISKNRNFFSKFHWKK